MTEQLALLDKAYMARDRLLDYFSNNHSQYVESLRAFAIAKCRYVGTVTIDDLRDVLTEKNYPLPHEIGADDRLLGTVLSRCRELRSIGVVQTRRQEVIARVGKTRSLIAVYELRDVA